MVGHKTGNSSRNADGLKAGDNDAGILILPNGQAVAIAVFVSDSKLEDNANAEIIARVSEAVWDYYQ